MLDPQLLRNDLTAVADKLKQQRAYHISVDEVAQLEAQRKQLQSNSQQLQSERNALSKQIGKAKATGNSADEIMGKVSQINVVLKEQTAQLEQIQQQLQLHALSMPNLLHESVPIGQSEDENVEIRKWRQPTIFNFEVKDHVALGEKLGMDAKRATKIAGTRFMVLHHHLAALHRALIQFMLTLHTHQHGYQEVYVPYLVNDDSLYGTGQLPKFGDDLFSIQDWSLSLIPTAEVPVTNLMRGEILENIPLKFVAHTPCFRSEAGSYGRDTKGFIRQHQFEKVELVQFVHPNHSYQALEELTGHAEAVLQQLELPYRVMSLCSGDTGFSAAKTYDLEVWLPGQDCYREISSCSNFEAFQARRMKTRFRNDEGDVALLHTLNGSGLAVGRTLVAILENYQQKNGDVVIPEVLRPYMNNREKLEAK